MAARANHRSLFRSLTVRRGSFDLRPTATAWWLKDIALLGLAGWALSQATDDEEHRLAASLLLPVSAADVAFRVVATLVSGLLLASLVCPRPAFFRRCFWAHASCLPADIALSLAFILLKAELEPSWKYASPWIESASNSNSGTHDVVVLAPVDGHGGAGTGTVDFRLQSHSTRHRESQRGAVATNVTWSRNWNVHNRAAFSNDFTLPTEPPLTKSSGGFPAYSIGKKRRAAAEATESGGVTADDNPNDKTSTTLHGLQGIPAEPAVEEDSSRKADVVRGQLGAFLLADHVICLFARCYLLMRMRACLIALVIDEAGADAMNEGGAPLQDAVSPSASGDPIPANRV